MNLVQVETVTAEYVDPRRNSINYDKHLVTRPRYVNLDAIQHLYETSEDGLVPPSDLTMVVLANGSFYMKGKPYEVAAQLWGLASLKEAK